MADDDWLGAAVGIIIGLAGLAILAGILGKKKCPRCGTEMPSTVANCPICGWRV